MQSGRLRLLHLREQTEAVGETMAAERLRFARLADPESAPRVVSAFNLFQTPPALAERLAGLLGPCERVLEPSAGLGRLYRAARINHAGPIVLVEIAPDCCRELYGMTREDDGATLKQGDFLEKSPAELGLFDGVLMNPPFKMGRDIKHILHARQFLTAGGKLVALCANGPRQQERLRPLADSWEELPPSTFQSEGTRVNAALLTMTI